jgi:hypothetical protein
LRQHTLAKRHLGFRVVANDVNLEEIEEMDWLIDLFLALLKAGSVVASRADVVHRPF